MEDEDLGAADTDGDGVAGDDILQDTAPPKRRQQEHPGIAEDGIAEDRHEGEERQDGRGNELQHEKEDSGSGQASVSMTEPDSAEESTDASEANEPAAEAAQETASPSPSPSPSPPSSADGPASPSETPAASEAARAPSSEDDSWHDREAPSKEKRPSDGSGDSSNGAASPSPSSVEHEGRPPQEREHVDGPEGEAATGSAHEDEDDSSSAGSDEGGGAPDSGAASAGEDTNVDAAAGARRARGANNVRSLLAAEKPFRERAASWAWMMRSWPSAGGKHH